MQEIEKTMEVLDPKKTVDFSKIIQTGTQRGLVNSNPTNGIFDRRHSLLTLQVIQDNADVIRSAEKVEFEAALETIGGIPQSVPDIKLTVNQNGVTKVILGEVYAGTAGAKSNLASQSLTYFQTIEDLNDIRFFRRLNLADKEIAKQAVIESWKNGGLLNDQKTIDLFKKLDEEILETGFNPAVDSFEDFLKKNDEWFDLIFNNKF
ncbi:MAG TPA: hypothetical protein DCP28_22555 [Cytophagales bacterium]|nr:hypothetical protein [Cytophagales bacterium]